MAPLSKQTTKENLTSAFCSFISLCFLIEIGIRVCKIPRDQANLHVGRWTEWVKVSLLEQDNTAYKKKKKKKDCTVKNEGMKVLE